MKLNVLCAYTAQRIGEDHMRYPQEVDAAVDHLVASLLIRQVVSVLREVKIICEQNL